MTRLYGHSATITIRNGEEKVIYPLRYPSSMGEWADFMNYWRHNRSRIVPVTAFELDMERFLSMEGMDDD